jgi:DnaJ like chaperone protein
MMSFLIFIILVSIFNIFSKAMKWENGNIHVHRYQKSDFLETFLILAADVIKADGHFTRSELEYLRAYLTRNLGPTQAHQALLRLQEIMQENYNLASVCSTMRSSANIHERLLVIQLLFGIAASDGLLHPAELTEIEKIAMMIGVSRGDYESIKSMYVGGYSSYGYSSGDYSSSGGSTFRSHTLSDDYKILEISENASDDEVKKAYRTMAKKYHPDRVAHLGDEMRKQAEEKFAKMSDAYERIKKARGMK